MEISQNTGRSDVWGAAVSALCAIHCTLTPLIFAAKPLLISTVAEPEVHTDFWHFLDYIFVILSFMAVLISTRNTTFKALVKYLWIAWVIFALGILAEQLEIHTGIWLMYIGSVSLIIAHIKNYRYCKKCEV